MELTNQNQRLSWRLAELAKASGLSVGFLRKAKRDGVLKTKKIGAAVIVLDQDAKEFLSGATTSQKA